MSTEHIPRQKTKQYIEIPIAEFNRIPMRRARYIIAYGLGLILLIGPRVYMMMRQVRMHDITAWAIFIAVIVAYVVFYWNFVKTLRTLAYPMLFIVFLCMAVFLPMPGLLAVAWVDKRVANVWDAASPGPSYRKEPPKAATDES